MSGRAAVEFDGTITYRGMIEPGGSLFFSGGEDFPRDGTPPGG
jgi:hypothetical protein